MAVISDGFGLELEDMLSRAPDVWVKWDSVFSAKMIKMKVDGSNADVRI